MRHRTALLTLAAFALAACAAARAQEPQKDEQVIDDFVTTRGMSFDGPGKQTQKQAKPAPRRNNSAKGKRPGAVPPPGGAASGKTPVVKGGAAGKSDKVGGDTAEAGAQVEGAAVVGAKAAQAGLRPLALGFTMFTKDDENRLSFVEPSKEFRTDDRIAIAFETNADGYLYMFNASGDAKTPEMVFPNASLDGGDNALPAHTYVTFPSDVEAGFVFTDPPATEHLFVVFSRKPLAGVPTGEALVKFCRGKGEECAWPLSAALWARILDGAKGRRVTEAKNTRLAQAAPPPDAPALMQRGLKVKKDAPRPAFVRVNDSPAADVLVTEIVLTHK
jgi:hypothetical protein